MVLISGVLLALLPLQFVSYLRPQSPDARP